jgi:uncharacterized membrane protein
MKTFFVGYICFLLPMLAVDAVWLAVMSKRFYAARIGSLMSDSPRVAPAVVFYLIYALGPTVLVVIRAVNHNTGYPRVFLLGALLGLVAYATYDLTNQATLKVWPSMVTVVDLLWGALLTGAMSVVSVALTRLIL